MASEYLNNKTFEGLINSFQSFKRNKSKYELMIEDLEETYERKKRKGNLENRPLLKRKEEYQQISTNYHEYQEKLAFAFYTLSENIVRYAKFNLIDIDDAIQEGVLICFEKIDRFDARKGKAFNYMTTCILNHFRQLYRSARNYNELKKKYHFFLESFEKTVIRNGKERPYHRNNISYID